ncbi:MAG TPA: hypothetical protein VIF09_25430, partial [Polyangiaceae bacterium]
MKRTTRLGLAALALFATRGCTSSPNASAPGPSSPSLQPGEVCDPTTAPTVRLHFDPPSLVLAPGQTRPARVVMDPDACTTLQATMAMGDGSIAQAPATAPFDLRHPAYDFTVQGLAQGSTSLAVTVQRPTDTAPTTASLPIEVRADANPPTCTSGGSPGMSTLSGSSTTLSGPGPDLADASLSVPPGAFSRTDEFALPTFQAGISCAGDVTASAPGKPLALGPAVTFTPQDPSWLSHSLRRELDFAVPVNPATMPPGSRMRHLVVLYQGPMAKTPRVVTIANPRFDEQNGHWVLRFESPWFGTYQAAVSPDAGTVSFKRHLTHRAVLGISMGGGGAGIFGMRHHDQFDAIAPLGGNSDLTWLVWYFETFKFGGFCPVSNPSCTKYAPNMYPLNETFAHTEDFDHWFFQPGGGTGGSFSRGGWTQILEDFSIAGGNPNGQNADTTIPFMVVGPKASDPFVHGSIPGTDCSVTIEPISPNSKDPP